MLTAIYNNEKIFPTAGIVAKCPGCGMDVIPAMGKVNVHHWRHKTDTTCNYQQGETEWHRKFKSLFPVKYVEVKNGKHISDVFLPNGTCIEFQNSPIKVDDIISRTANYRNIIWVFNLAKQNMNGQVSMTSDCLEYKRCAKYYHKCGKNLIFDVGQSGTLFIVKSFSYLWSMNSKTGYMERSLKAIGGTIKRESEFYNYARHIDGVEKPVTLSLF